MKLSWPQVVAIRRRLKTRTAAELAVEFGVSASMIRRISTYRCWRAEPSGETRSNAKLTWRMVARLRSLAESGVSQPELGRIYGVSQTTVWRIVNNLAWRIM